MQDVSSSRVSSVTCVPKKEPYSSAITPPGTMPLTVSRTGSHLLFIVLNQFAKNSFTQQPRDEHFATWIGIMRAAPKPWIIGLTYTVVINDVIINVVPDCLLIWYYGKSLVYEYLKKKVVSNGTLNILQFYRVVIIKDNKIKCTNIS